MQRKNRSIHPLLLLGLVCIFLVTIGANVYGQYKIMPLGNSITEGINGSSVPGGYRDDLADMLTNEGVNFDFVGSLSTGTGFDADHEGHAGKSAAFINANVEGWLTTATPEFVLLHIGTNDISSATDLNTISSNISGIVDKIYAYDSNAKIILSSIIPRKDDKDSLTTELNKLILDIFYNKQNSGYPIYFAGHNDVFKATANWQTVLMNGGEGLHPNDTGYNTIAQTYFNSVMNAINSGGSDVTDNFNRSELGPVWAANPEFQIVNNELANTATDDGWNYLAVYSGQTNPTQVSIKWGAGANSTGISEGGLALRLDRSANNASGYLMLIRSNGNLNLWTIEGGLPNTEVQNIQGSAAAPQAGDVFRVVLSSDGAGHYFKCYINGQYTGEVVDTGKLQGNSPTQYAGVMLRGNYNNNVDDFNLFQEGDVTAPADITDLAVSGQATGSIALQWTVPGDDGDQGTASGYDIRYSKGNITSSNFNAATLASEIPPPGAPGTNQTFVVAGLSANTTYYFAIKTSDEVPNVSNISNVTSGTTISALQTVDDFEREALGADWSANAEFEIQNGELVNTASSQDWDHLAVYVPKKNPVEAWIKWSENVDPEGIGRGGLALMLGSASPDADGYLAWIRPNDQAITLFTITSGTPDRSINSKTWGGAFPQAGDIFKVAMTTDDNGHHFDYYLNDNFLTRITDTGKRKGNEETLYTGIMLHGGMNNNVEEFGVANQVGSPSQLEYISGSPQTGIAGQALPDSFVVRVTDDNSNPIAGVPITFEVTEGSGQLDMEASPDDNIRIQAESALLTPPMQIFTDDPDASNGQYICPPTGDSRDGRAEYSVYIKESGDYRIWGRVKSKHTQGASFHVVMDTGAELRWDVPRQQTWIWDLVSNKGNGTTNNPETDPVIFTLEAGLHKLTILEGWYNTCIDNIIFTKDPGFVPSGKEEYKEYVTDARGFSAAHFTLGAIADTNIVSASTPSLAVPPIEFIAIGMAASPESLNYVSGNDQSGMGGEQLADPFVVVVVDGSGNPVSNIPVLFSITQGNGVLSNPQPTYTDGTGEASTFYTLGTDVELNQVVAISDSVPGIEVVFSANATGGIAYRMKEDSGNNQSGPVGQKLPAAFVVRILNESGDPVKNHSVQFEIIAGNSSFFNETETQIAVKTDSQGLAAAWLVLGTDLDTTKVTASSNGSEGPLVDSPVLFTAVGIAGAPATLECLSGNNQTGAAGCPLRLPLVMKVTDQHGNPINGHAIEFTVKAAGGNIDGETSKTVYTESDGTTFIIYTLGPTVGETNRVEAAALNGATPLANSPYSFEFVSGEVQLISYVSGNQQQGSAGFPLPEPFKVIIQDNFGNPVPGYDEVHFEITQGDATFNGAVDTTVQTDFDGISQVTMTLGLALGGNFEAKVNAYKNGVPLQGNPITFTATAAGLSQLQYVSGDDQTGETGSPLPEPLRLKILDEQASGIKGQTVHFEVTGGGGYINGQRQADILTGDGGIVDAIFTVGPAPGDSNHTVQASASYNGNPLEGSPYTFYSSASIGKAKKLTTISDNLNGVVGNPLAEPFKVKVTDIADNPIAEHSVAFTVLEGGGFFTDNGETTQTVITGSDGIAAVDLTLGETAGNNNNVIQAVAMLSAQHLQGSPDTLRATAKSSAAENLQLTDGNAQTGIAGTPLTQPFMVKVTDDRGNGVALHPVTFIVKGGGGNLDGTGETTRAVNTNEDGFASTILTLGPKAGIANVVQAFSTNGSDTLNGAPVTFSANSTPGPVSATASTIVCEPDEVTADGETAAVITVTLMDSFKNPIANKFVTLSATGTSHTLDQPQTQTGSDGVATGSIKSTKAEVKIITARDMTDNLDLTTVSQVRFTALDAHQLTQVAGNAQIGNINTALPEKLTAMVADKYLNPIFNHEVQFVVTAGGGCIYEVQPAYTDSNGLAEATLILGETPGITNTVEARSPGLNNSPIVFMATGTNGKASRIARVSGDNQTVMSGMMLPRPFVTQVLDDNGRCVAQFTVTYKVDLGSGHFNGENSLIVETDAFGLATAWFTLGKEIGTNLVKAYATGLSDSPISFIANGSAGKASVLKMIAGNDQSGLVGGYLSEPLRVQVTDYNGNGVAGKEVTYMVETGDAFIVEAQPQQSDANGFVNATVRFGTMSGQVIIEASSANLVDSPARFTATAEALQAKSMKILTGNNQQGTIGRELVYPLAIEVNDIHGNPVSGIGVSYAVIEGAGTLLDGQVVQSDSDGIARNRLQLGPNQGANTVYAIKTGLDNSPLVFNATGVTNKFPLFEIICDTTVNELQRLSFTVKATDDDGETVSYGIRKLPQGAEFDSSTTQLFGWTPDYNQGGRHVVTFMAFDGRGGFDAEDVVINVKNINRKPKIIAYLPSETNLVAPKHGKVVFSVVVSDDDQDQIQYKWYRYFMGERLLVSTSPSYEFISDEHPAGIYSTKVWVSDGIDSTSMTWNMTWTSVQLAAFSAEVIQFKGVKLNWQTSLEQDNLGFNIYRSNSKDGEYRRINPEPVPNNVDGEYHFNDHNVKSARVYYYKLEDIDASGRRTLHDAISVKVTQPSEFVLYQNYPNPFNPVTKMAYQLPKRADVRLTIFNIMGQAIKTLVNEKQDAGYYTIHWDGNDENGISVASGVYFYRIKAAGFVQTKRMVLLK